MSHEIKIINGVDLDAIAEYINNGRYLNYSIMITDAGEMDLVATGRGCGSNMDGEVVLAYSLKTMAECPSEPWSGDAVAEYLRDWARDEGYALVL